VTGREPRGFRSSDGVFSCNHSITQEYPEPHVSSTRVVGNPIHNPHRCYPALLLLLVCDQSLFEIWKIYGNLKEVESLSNASASASRVTRAL
jgi:hypothetical protein